MLEKSSPKVFQKVATAVFHLKIIVSKLASTSLNIRATFKRKLVTKNIQKLPNLVTLLSSIEVRQTQVLVSISIRVNDHLKKIWDQLTEALPFCQTPDYLKLSRFSSFKKLEFSVTRLKDFGIKLYKKRSPNMYQLLGFLKMSL